MTRAEHEVKKSRFIAFAYPAASREEALAHLDETKRLFPDARHHCWAYLVGNPYSPQAVAMSDDGEPSGTAGKPILNVLEHKEVGDVMLIVVRYFGGVKLGAGGLVRAYSAAAEQVMSVLPLCTKAFLAEAVVEGGFSLEQGLRHWLVGREGDVLNVDYRERVRVRLALREDDLAELEGFIAAHGARLVVVNKKV